MNSFPKFEQPRLIFYLAMTRHIPISAKAGNIAVGLNKGHITKALPKQEKISRTKGVCDSLIRIFANVFFVATEQACQVRPWCHPGGCRLRSLWEADDGVVACRQGQACPEVHQEPSMFVQLFSFPSQKGFNHNCFIVLVFVAFTFLQLGTHLRGKKKREELMGVIVAQRKLAASKKADSKE
jgi:hypothetical protein